MPSFLSSSDLPASGVAASLACLSLLGPDAATFLQGQLTCDVRPLAWRDGKGGVSLAARLNLKGRVMASLYVLGVPDGFLLLLPQAQADALLADLKKYVLFSKAKLVRETYSVRALPADDRLAAGAVIETDAGVLAHLPGLAVCLRITQDAQSETDSHAFELAEMQAGVAQILPQTAGLWLPQELGYDALGGVSYNKGCYLGQEIVARVHFKGEVKQRLYGLLLESTTAQPVPPPAANLTGVDGKTLGQVVQALPTDSPQRLACLAVLREPVAGEVAAAGTVWQVAACQPAVAP